MSLTQETFTETLSGLQEQLSLPDSLLAIRGVGRHIAAIRSEITNIEEDIASVDNCRPIDPGPHPHPEDGGTDHEDWEVDRLDYEQHIDGDARAAKAENEIRKLQAELAALEDDQEFVGEGNETMVSQYAATERERIQAEIEKRIALAK